MSQQQQAEVVLDKYLQSLCVPTEWPRVQCCDVSRFLYCSECCRLLVPKEDWPSGLQNGTFRLPFPSLHVILRDRKTSATGLQATALLRATQSNLKQLLDDTKDDDKALVFDFTNSTTVSVYDIEANEELPNYESMNRQSNGSVYLLYPDETSVPLSSVTTDISTLVVLDCTWQRRKPSTLPFLACLPRVHLSSPPEESRFWRWHSAGPGMVSTIEALYYASWEIALQQGWPLQQLESLLNLMWLFGLQRYLITTKYSSDKVKSLPFTPDGKEFRRKMFRTMGTEKHQLDIEKGKLLKKQHREERKKATKKEKEAVKTS